MLHAHVSLPFTLFCAGMTDICADTAELIAEASAHAHYLRGYVTYGGTFKIQLDTGPQCVNVLFVQTGHGTVITFGCTCLAGFNTLLILLV